MSLRRARAPEKLVEWVRAEFASSHAFTLLVCLYASPCVSLQVLDLERRELLSMDATDQSPVLLLLFALRPSLCCVQKAIL